MEPLHSGHLQTTDTGRLSQALRYMEAPLYNHISKISIYAFDRFNYFELFLYFRNSRAFP